MAKTIEEINNQKTKNEDMLEYLSDYKKENNDKEPLPSDSFEHFYWRPVVDNLSPLCSRLIWILKDAGMMNDCAYLTTKDIIFFKGLKYAGIQDADQIIEALEKYGYIEIYEQ